MGGREDNGGEVEWRVDGGTRAAIEPAKHYHTREWEELHVSVVYHGLSSMVRRGVAVPVDESIGDGKLHVHLREASGGNSLGGECNLLARHWRLG